MGSHIFLGSHIVILKNFFYRYPWLLLVFTKSENWRRGMNAVRTLVQKLLKWYGWDKI